MQRETDDEILETKENDFDEINDLISMTPEEVEKMHSAANEVIDNLPEKDRKIVKEYTRRTELFAGPVPHPEILRQYNEIDPGIADRIIKMAEKDQDHVIECNKKSLELQKRDNFFGMIFAFVIVLLR